MEKAVSVYLTKELCTGCGACSSICPVGAIQMEQSREGFLVYHIDERKCVDCGMCAQKCPVLNTRYKNSESPRCYAVWAEDDIRAISSSGGVFSVLAEYILGEGGYVCGVVHNEDFSAKHVVSNEPDVIGKMRGSKYVQSNINHSYDEIKNVLEKGKTVLFTGMPCQVAGLYAFLGNSYEALYTVELVCHGNTSTRVLARYREDVFSGKEITNLEYKKKAPWGWHAGINAEFSDGSEYSVPAEEDPYFRAFLNNISKNSACGECKFNHMPRQADLTIGDFWKIGDFDKTLNDNKGTSLVLVNNQKGNKLLEAINLQLQRCVEVPLTYAIQGNGSLKAPYKNHFRRKKFFRELEAIRFDKLVNHCMDNHFDIGIVGLWYGLNYGSILTYYALYCVVNQLGYDAIMVNKPEYIWRPLYEKPDTIANRFITKHCCVSHLHKYEEFPILNQHCDSFIVGSDVVWNYEICGKEAGNFFYLDFVDEAKKKIAYAASFGGGYNAPEEERYMNQKYAQLFDAISVREDKAVNICKEQFGVEAQKVLDPVFLCDFSKFSEAADQADREIEEPYIMTYILGGNDLQRNIILDVSKKLKIEKLVNVVNPNNPVRVMNALQLDAVKQPSVEEWLWYMKHTEYFIGDSFHGLCFAIIFRKPFLIVISKNMPSKDRFITLLQMCGLEERLTYIEDNENKDYLLKQSIDYDDVYKKLDKYKVFSLQWLKDKLCREKKRREIPVNVPDGCDAELFCLAKAVYENAHGRQIVTWGDNVEFRTVLKQYFGLDVPFWVARNLSLVDGKSIHSYEELKDRSGEFYLVIPSNPYKESDVKWIEAFGYKNIKDYIYRYHEPIVLTGGSYRDKSYFDVYGNKVVGDITGKFVLNLGGFGNEVVLSKDITASEPVEIMMNGNAELYIGEKCKFSGESNIIFWGARINHTKSRVSIMENCSFQDCTITIWENPGLGTKGTGLLINRNCTFARDNISVNSGKKVIFGEDCMFSYNISVQCGDGHAMLDVRSGDRINPFTDALRKDKDLLVLGDHVWVGRNALILNGTNVGSGSIIGAGSVVKGRYPNNCSIAGNPAYIVREDVAWSRDNRADELLQIPEAYRHFTNKSRPPISGKKVLVVGGTRFMGIKLVHELLKLGNDVTIATRGKKKDEFGNRVKRIVMDISNPKSVAGALQGQYYEVVFDNIAYCSEYVRNILSVVKCGRYIQLSSVETYVPTQIDLREQDFAPHLIEQKWCNTSAGYQEGKKQAEAAVYQVFPDVSSVTVRIPYVTPTDRILYYCKHIINQIPMSINDISRGFTFVRDSEVGRFLPWIAAQDYAGPINLASTGFVTISMILEYVEKKVGKKAIIDARNGVKSPFHEFDEKTFSLNMDKAKQIGYEPSNINSWFWDLMDEYIQRALNENKER